MEDDKNTKDAILEAATMLFYHKGFAGTRMHEIATAAGINKAMLHYYFVNKETLFHAVFDKALDNVMMAIIQLMNESTLPLQERIELFVSAYIDAIRKHPYVPVFVFSELRQNPDRLKQYIQDRKLTLQPLFDSFQKSQSHQQEGYMQFMDLFVSIIGMCMFPIISRPIVQLLFSVPDEAYDAFLEQRKKTIPAFIKQVLKP